LRPSKKSYGLGLYTGSSVSEIVKRAKSAEKMGFDWVSISEDPYYRDSLPVTAMVAHATSRIKVVTGIINVYTKSPVYTAMAAATLDEISGERLILGLGRGVKSLIQGELHIDYGSPLQYTKEYLVCLKALLAGKKVTYDGSQVKLTNAQLHFKPTRENIPTVIAAMGPKTISLAANQCDGLMLNSCTSVRHARFARKAFDRHWKRHDRPIFSGGLWTSVDEDLDAAYDAARVSVGFLVSIPTFGETFLRMSGFSADFLPELRKHFRWDEDVGDPMWHVGNARRGSLDELVSDEIVDALAVCGPVERCRKRFSEYFDAGLTTAVISPMTTKTFSSLRQLIG
jgi:alkanesulfonate monooxygenase SsuD/methylene tetrahydromethanopterin reductase-like flavin-dependent oxidoreductase (luciferase family)